MIIAHVRGKENTRELKAQAFPVFTPCPQPFSPGCVRQQLVNTFSVNIFILLFYYYPFDNRHPTGTHFWGPVRSSIVGFNPTFPNIPYCR